MWVWPQPPRPRRSPSSHGRERAADDSAPGLCTGTREQTRVPTVRRQTLTHRRHGRQCVGSGVGAARFVAVRSADGNTRVGGVHTQEGMFRSGDPCHSHIPSLPGPLTSLQAGGWTYPMTADGWSGAGASPSPGFRHRGPAFGSVLCHLSGRVCPHGLQRRLPRATSTGSPWSRATSVSRSAPRAAPDPRSGSGEAAALGRCGRRGL